MRAPRFPDMQTNETFMQKAILVTSIGAVLLASPLLAFSQPADRPIRLVVPFGAGSSVDSTARPFGQALSDITKQATIVDNRPGAEGLIGAKAVINAVPDGFTAMFTSNSVPTLLPVLKKEAPFDPGKDLQPICSISKAPMNIFVRSSLPFKTVGEFIAAAKANPGKYTFAYSTGLNRLGAELFQQQTGIQLLGVGYKATAQALLGMLAGEVDMIVADVSTAGAHYQTGKMRPLLVADAKRAAALPEAPAAPEAGLDNYSVAVWFGLYLPAGTPKAVTARFEALVKAAARSETVRDANKAGGREEMLLCGDDLRQYQEREIQHWRDVIKKARIELVD